MRLKRWTRKALVAEARKEAKRRWGDLRCKEARLFLRVTTGPRERPSKADMAWARECVKQLPAPEKEAP